VNINSKQFHLFNDEVRRHGELWLRGECGILQSRVTSTKSSKRKKKNPQYGSDGVKSKMEDQRKRPKNDKYLLSSRGLLSKNRQSKRKKKSPHYGSDGGKSKMGDQRKRPENDKDLLSSRGLLSNKIDSVQHNRIKRKKKEKRTKYKQ
tara:strand:- start:193 stop:636 length:444 start_codon:yes stop_codon:yes gene_type:complete